MKYNQRKIQAASYLVQQELQILWTKYEQMCNFCNRYYHFEKFIKNIHTVEFNQPASEDGYFNIHIMDVNNINPSAQIFCNIIVDLNRINIQVDSGSTYNVISTRDLDRLGKAEIRPAEQKFCIYYTQLMNPGNQC